MCSKTYKLNIDSKNLDRLGGGELFQTFNCRFIDGISIISTLCGQASMTNGRTFNVAHRIFLWKISVSFINIKFSHCKGCEITVGDSYDLRSYAFFSSVYFFLISSRVYYQQCFLSLFVLLIKNCHCHYEF